MCHDLKLAYSWLSIKTKCAYFHFWSQNGVEADTHANYVPICAVKLIGVDAKSENVPGSPN